METKRFYVLFYVIIFLIISSCKENKSLHLNLDFENVDSHTKKALAWRYTENGYKVSIDKEVVNHGKYSLKIESPSGQNDYNNPCFVQIMFDSIQGNQKIKISGFIKNEGTNCDSLGLTIFCKSPVHDAYKVLKSKNFNGSHDWQEYAIELTSPDKTEYILFGIKVLGSGIIWADNLKFYLNDKQIINLPVSNTFKASKNEINWLKNHVIPLKTVYAEKGFNDLSPLKESLKNARLIALGENSHGTSEIFEMKHRLLEFLSKEMGFNVFLIESAMFDSDPINDYVHNGNGDPKALMANLTPAWYTQEVLDMIKWMRNYNEKGSKKIQFTGIDMTSYNGSLRSLLNFTDNHDVQLPIWRKQSGYQKTNDSKNQSNFILFEKHGISNKYV
jgi:erythromycin esterase